MNRYTPTLKWLIMHRFVFYQMSLVSRCSSSKQYFSFPGSFYLLVLPSSTCSFQGHTEGDVAAAAKSLQSCPTLCDPRDGSPPGSSVPGILQARTLEWVAISFSSA